ncbi:hypothetical protein [Paraburkholderia tuberum]|nr:hypothetical protein [Paraburkholderia tuberum]
MEQINPIEDLTHDGASDSQYSQVLEPLATSEASTPHPESAESATGEFDPLPDVQDGDDPELSNWRASVEAYVATQTQPFTVDDVLEHGLHFTPGGWDRSEQMRVAAILRELGFDRQQRRIEGVRAQYWSSPTMGQPHQEVAAAVFDEQHVEPAEAMQPTPAPEQDGSIIGDAVDDDTAAPSAPVEPAQPTEPAESASTRYARLSARQTDIKRKLADAQRVLHFAQDARKQTALAAVEGGFKAEAAYYEAVEKHTQASAHVEQLTAALAQVSADLQRASVYAEAERRVLQCQAVRDAARRVEAYGPKIEGLLTDLGKAVSGYLHDVNVVYRKAWPVMTGQHEVATPWTEPVSCALMGHFLRSAGLDPEFFTDLSSHGLNGLLRYETPSQVVDMQLGNIVERLADNYLELIEVREVEPETAELQTGDTWAEVTRGHELVPPGIFPTQSTDAD